MTISYPDFITKETYDTPVYSWTGTANASTSVETVGGFQIRKNLFTNPSCISGGLSINGYFGGGGAGSISYMTSGGPTSGPTTYARLTVTTAGTWCRIGRDATFNIQSDTNYIGISGWVRTSTTQTVALRKFFKDDTNTTIAESNAVVDEASMPANTWVYLNAVFPVVSRATKFQMLSVTTANTCAVGDTLDTTGLMVFFASTEEEALAAVNAGFFDGSTTSTEAVHLSGTDVVARNLLANPAATTGWINNTGGGATSSRSYLSGDGPTALGGPDTYVRLTVTADGTWFRLTNADYADISNAAYIGVSMYARPSAAMTLSMRGHWYDASKTQLSESTISGQTLSFEAGEWRRFVTVIPAPTGAAAGATYLRLAVNSVDTYATTGLTLDATGSMIVTAATEADALAQVEEYFDADTDDYYWINNPYWEPRTVWDGTGERKYELGVDHGVLYLDTDAVNWNGLTGVTVTPEEGDSEPYYIDGVKRFSVPGLKEINGSIEAYTAPRELAQYVGEAELIPGVTAYQQKRRPFNFAYRTLIGNDVLGQNYGYKIHILYNVLAEPAELEHTTIEEDPELQVYSWDFTTTPIVVDGYARTSYFTIDSTKVDPVNLAYLESIMYGYGAESARLPLPDEILTILSATTVGG